VIAGGLSLEGFKDLSALAGPVAGGAESGLTRPDVALTSKRALKAHLVTFADRPSLRSLAGHRHRVSSRASPLASGYYLISGLEQGAVTQVAQVIERTLIAIPRDATHWSIRSMAAGTGLSHTTIRQIWAAFGLQPHRSESFKLSTDPLFADKVQDIVGLYMSPPNRAVVLRVDEKSQGKGIMSASTTYPCQIALPNESKAPSDTERRQAASSCSSGSIIL
jgi:hypothetical protein